MLALRIFPGIYSPLFLPQFILPTTEPAVVSKMLRYFLTELTESAALQRFTETANRRWKH